jgi:hypothetical protein
MKSMSCLGGSVLLHPHRTNEKITVATDKTGLGRLAFFSENFMRFECLATNISPAFFINF